VVVLPRRMALAEAERLVAEHHAWLDRHLSRVNTERERLAARPALGEGRVLSLAGEPCRVSTVDAGARRPARGRVDPVPGGIVVRLGRDGRDTVQLLEAWLRERAREVIAARVRARAPELEVRPGRITIRDQSTGRWWNCTRRAPPRPDAGCGSTPPSYGLPWTRRPAQQRERMTKAFSSSDTRCESSSTCGAALRGLGFVWKSSTASFNSPMR